MNFPSKPSQMDKSTRSGLMPSRSDLSATLKAMDDGWAAFRKAHPMASIDDFLDSPDAIKNLLGKEG